MLWVVGWAENKGKGRGILGARLAYTHLYRFDALCA